LACKVQALAYFASSPVTKKKFYDSDTSTSGSEFFVATGGLKDPATFPDLGTPSVFLMAP
jgi:hypothetical protein